MKGNSMLKAESVVKNFGGLRAVDRCSFEVDKGSIVGLIGPNGAGKTTLFNVITGMYQPDAGRVLFKGEEISGLRPDEICHRGITRTFQVSRELKIMTVLENMLLAFKDQKGENILSAVLKPTYVLEQEKENLRRSLEILKTLNLYELRNESVAILSGGQRKMLEVGQALATGPELLLLDEPTAGATFAETGTVVHFIKWLREEQGLTFLIVEHKMEVIMNICDRIIVVNYGKKLMEGTPAEVRANKEVREAYLGREG
jgi:ABC-type branched-subunit amino acid transport system ATPase component